MTKKKENPLVQMVQPTATTAYDQANMAVQSIPSARLPTVVRDAGQQSVVVDILRQVATATKTVEAKEKEGTKLLDQTRKWVKGLFTPLKTHLKDLRTDLEGKLDEYRDWQEQEAEVEREKLRKKAEAQRKRADTIARKKLEAATSRAERARIKAQASAKADVARAVLDARLADVDDTPDSEEGVAGIEDIEIVTVDMKKVPETAGGYVIWERTLKTGNLKKALKAGVDVEGVTWQKKRRRAVRSL
jgi:ATPase subunit of ABC transporter with duplicated ATPase domains